MKGFVFSKFKEGEKKPAFDRLMDMFLELLQYTNGDPSEALHWLTQLDQQYGLTSDEYGVGDFIEDLIEQLYLKKPTENEVLQITAKTEQAIRKRSLEEIFGKLKKGRKGNHTILKSGQGEEINPETRPYAFGDAPDTIDYSGSLKNSFIRHGIDQLSMNEEDLEVHETDYKTQTSTVLMIDISHSMILYGEDRITPAKKVAMALSELIMSRYPKDTLDLVVFGDDAWQIEVKDLPYLSVGPYHTNTVAGLELAMDILRKRKNGNKQIFMITDGKPTCLKKGNKYYKNSFGIDNTILNRTLNLAGQLRRLKIPVITFMVAQDPFLQRFVRKFTEVNNGKAFYASLDGLGSYVFEDYERNKKKNLR